ncbi:MAG: hypothetical protein WCK36_00575, partial [Candidatus Firestonebacteria bacterium]
MKKGTKRKIFYTALGIIFLLGLTVFTLAKTGVFVRQFKNIIETELSKNLNREVTIGKIEGGIFDSIDLINVRIASKKELKDGTIIVIDKVSVKYNFNDIVFRKKQVIESLKGIELIRPSLLIENNEQGSWNIIDFINSLPVAENQVFPEKLTITVSKGLIGITDSKKKFNSSFRDIYGRVNFLGQGKVSVKSGMKSFSSKKTNLHLDGIFDLKNKNKALVISGNDLELAHYGAYALTYLPPDKAGKIFIKDGKFDLMVNISEELSADLLVKKGEVGFADFKAGLSGIMSEVALTGKNLKIKKFASVLKNSAITAKGDIKNAFEENPEAKLSIYVNRASLGDLAGEDFFKGLNVSGICNAGIMVEGLLSSPAINVFANVRDLNIGGFKSENNEFVLRYKDNRTVIETLKINAFDGLAKLSGNYDNKNNYLFLFGNAVDMQFGEILDAAGIAKASGKAAFSLEIKGPLEDLSVASKVTVKKAALLSGSLGEITGDLLFYKNNKLKVNAVSTEKLRMQSVFTFENKKTYADGFIKLSGTNFKDAYGYFVENKMELGGESTALFSLKGPLEDISLSGDVAINNFNFEGYKAKTARGNLTVKKGALIGSGLYFNQDDTGYLKADGSLGLTGEMALDLEVSASKADFSKIPVFNTYYKMSGRGAFAGKILGNLTYPKFIVTLTSDNMILDGNQSLKADLSFLYNNSTLRIDKLNIDNEYIFNGEITFLNKPHLDSNLSIKEGKLSTLFTVFKLPQEKEATKGLLNGGIKLSGDFDNLNGEGVVNSKNAFALGRAIDLFGLKFEVKNSIFTVKSFDFGTENLVLTAGGMISLKKKGTSSLDFNMSNTFGKNKINGRYNISAGGLFDGEKVSYTAKLRSQMLSFNEQKVNNLSGDIIYDRKENSFRLEDLKWEKLTGKAAYTFKNKGLSAGLNFAATDLRKLSFLDHEAKKTLIAGELTGFIDVKTDASGNLISENIMTVTNPQYGDFKANRITANFNLGRSPAGYNIELSRLLVSQEKGSLDINGTLFSPQEFSPEKTECDLTVSLMGVDVKNLLPLIKSKVDLSAELQSSLGIKIKGKLAAPSVSGFLSARNVRAGALLLGDFKGEFDYNNSVLNFKDLNFDDMRLDNHADFRKAVFTFKKDYVEAQLSVAADFKQLFGLRLKADVETGNFRLLAGADPVVESELTLKNFSMNDYNMNNFAFRVSSSKTGLKLKNNSDNRGNTSTVKGELIYGNNNSVEFKEVQLNLYDNTAGLVKINGVSGPVSNMVIDVSNTNVKPILKYFDMDFSMSGTVNNARAVVRGAAAAPVVSVGGILRDVNVFNMAFTSVTGNLNLTDNKMVLSQVIGEQRDTSGVVYLVKVDGSIPLNQEEEQDLHIVLNNT